MTYDLEVRSTSRRPGGNPDISGGSTETEVRENLGPYYHRIHVFMFFFVLDLVDFYGKCRYISIRYMDPI